MKNFHIIANSIKDPDGKYTAQLEEILYGLGAASVTTGREPSPESEAVLVLGGDGTILKAAGDTFGMHKPLLGINIGNLGYLTESDLGTMADDMKRLICDDFSLQDRMMLQAQVFADTIEPLRDHCLNDISFTGYGALSLIRYDIYVNDRFLNHYSADGLVVCTPTGSTGYNLSAGGPIVEPGAGIIVLTPICPHTLNTRSIVLSPTDEIRVVISDSCQYDVAVQFDGREPVMIRSGQSVNITGSKEVTTLIKLNEDSFLSTLHEKLKP